MKMEVVRLGKASLKYLLVRNAHGLVGSNSWSNYKKGVYFVYKSGIIDMKEQALILNIKSVCHSIKARFCFQ